MRGVGRATAAITVVNALPTGIGAALGIDLPAEVSVTLEPRRGARRRPTVRPRASATRLLAAALATAVDRLPGRSFVPREVVVRSEIPPATGLKSSSAVASATVLAVAHAARQPIDPVEAARLSADIGRAAGVSATGAFDDALAGLVGGAVVTDNRSDRLLRSFRVDRRLAVALWIPPGHHPPAPTARERFRPPRRRAQATVRAARAGRLWEAMELNSAIVEEAMGYPYAGVRRRLLALGAIAAGTSGLGPTLAAIATRRAIAGIERELARYPGRTLVVGPSPARSPPGAA